MNGAAAAAAVRAAEMNAKASKILTQNICEEPPVFDVQGLGPAVYRERDRGH
jgi:hypothetical protein